MTSTEHRARDDPITNPTVATLATYNTSTEITVYKRDAEDLKSGRRLSTRAINYGLFAAYNTYNETLYGRPSQVCLLTTDSWVGFRATQGRWTPPRTTKPPHTFRYILAPVVVPATPQGDSDALVVPKDHWLLAVFVGVAGLGIAYEQGEGDPQPAILLLDSDWEASGENAAPVNRTDLFRDLRRMAESFVSAVDKAATRKLVKRCVNVEVRAATVCLPFC